MNKFQGLAAIAMAVATPAGAQENVNAVSVSNVARTPAVAKPDIQSQCMVAELKTPLFRPKYINIRMDQQCYADKSIPVTEACIREAMDDVKKAGPGGTVVSHDGRWMHDCQNRISLQFNGVLFSNREPMIVSVSTHGGNAVTTTAKTPIVAPEGP